MTDIVERLNSWGEEHFGTQYPATPLMHEAADEIMRLRAEVDELRAVVMMGFALGAKESTE